MSRFRPLGLVLAVVVFGALVAFPFLVPANWIVNIAIFTLMYAGLATAWNLLGGYSGYVSLGHVAFFGIGAYAIAIAFQHGGIGNGYVPFLVLPLVGVGAALVSIPIAWVAFRTRGSTFAIVTLTFLFVVQQLAFNLHGLTNGSQGIGMPVPPFPRRDVRTSVLPRDAGVVRRVDAGCVGTCGAASSGSCCSRSGTTRTAPAASASGRNRAKLIAFAISVGLTAMVGGVWAYYLSFIYPQFAIDPLITIGTVLMVYLGGQGHAVGTGARGGHPGSGAAVPGLPAGGESALPGRVRLRVPRGHAGAPARDHPVASRSDHAARAGHASGAVGGDGSGRSLHQEAGA